MSSSKKSNVALLTEGAAYIQRAKKARREQIEDVKFDDDARRLVSFSSSEMCGALEGVAECMAGISRAMSPLPTPRGLD
jgi:hypothetical protein